MWAMVGGWVRTLIVIVLVGNLVDIVMPKGDLRRYAGLVVGLVILAVMIRPLSNAVSYVNRDHPVSAFSWVSRGPSLTGAIASEERHQAEAMVETVPGVRACIIRSLSSSNVGVLVNVAPRTSLKLVRTMAKQAVSLTMGRGVRVAQLRIVSPKDS